MVDDAQPASKRVSTTQRKSRLKKRRLDRKHASSPVRAADTMKLAAPHSIRLAHSLETFNINVWHKASVQLSIMPEDKVENFRFL